VSSLAPQRQSTSDAAVVRQSAVHLINQSAARSETSMHTQQPHPTSLHSPVNNCIRMACGGQGDVRAVTHRMPAGQSAQSHTYKLPFRPGVSVSGWLAVSLLCWCAARVLLVRWLVGRLAGRFCCGHVGPNGRQPCQPASTLEPGSQPAHPSQAVDQLVAPTRPSHMLAISCVFVTRLAKL